MSKRHYSWLGALALCTLAITGFALLHASRAQAQSPYPILNGIATKVIQKYQSSTCEQLWANRSNPAPQSPEEQRIIGVLHSDPQMQTAFINMVAPPIATKMFACGMIP